jgi:predicted DNA-binding protein (UPF0278 family)
MSCTGDQGKQHLLTGVHAMLLCGELEALVMFADTGLVGVYIRLGLRGLQSWQGVGHCCILSTYCLLAMSSDYR